ncbi:MAG: hypothetical protein DYG94_06820 [Leptolyngbya sp. PLA3]|nr:MAG: hypothetical protein EDM82_06165 [Cyanobacteria bacterium CYA]MCE7968441.1 hypothetical protein [Leptolyngbya sp. PL-A3]
MRCIDGVRFRAPMTSFAKAVYILSGMPLEQAIRSVLRVFRREDRAHLQIDAPAGEPQVGHYPALPGWTPDEIAILTPDQLSTNPPPPVLRDPAFPDEPTRRPPPRAEQPEPYHAYTHNAAGDDPPEDQALPPLRFTPVEPTFRPQVRVTPVEDEAGRLAVYYFEADTVDTFDSPNFWRAPHILPWKARWDVTGRGGVRYSIFRSGHHAPHSGPVLEFPFRATAMRLPDDWRMLNRAELERHALALGYALDRDATIREVFDWVRHTIVWSAQSKVRSTLDVFCTGVGACGQANALCSLLLELNGIRTRGVSGFDPIIRKETDCRGGGHSAAEYYDEDNQRWNYIDPYLDLLLPGVAAADFDAHEIGDLALGTAACLRPLKRQFMYRRYFDRLNRMIPVSMLQVDGDERRWGTRWPLVQPRPFAPGELFPETQTIHVRARYLLTNGQRVLHRSVRPNPAGGTGVVASPWATTAFEIRPRELLGID